MIALRLAVGLGIACGLTLALLVATAVGFHISDSEKPQEVTISEHFDWECIEWRAFTTVEVVYSDDDRGYIPEGVVEMRTSMICNRWEDQDGLPNRTKEEGKE